MKFHKRASLIQVATDALNEQIAHAHKEGCLLFFDFVEGDEHPASRLPKDNHAPRIICRAYRNQEFHTTRKGRLA